MPRLSEHFNTVIAPDLPGSAARIFPTTPRHEGRGDPAFTDLVKGLVIDQRSLGHDIGFDGGLRVRGAVPAGDLGEKLCLIGTRVPAGGVDAGTRLVFFTQSPTSGTFV